MSWLGRDALAAVGLIADHNGWLSNSSVSHFTTFLMMAVTVATFVFCVVKISEIFARLPLEEEKGRSKRDRNLIAMMSGLIAILCANLLLVGRFEGFSILLMVSVVASIYAVSESKLNQS